jgi:hypothetical protein
MIVNGVTRRHVKLPPFTYISIRSAACQNEAAYLALHSTRFLHAINSLRSHDFVLDLFAGHCLRLPLYSRDPTPCYHQRVSRLQHMETYDGTYGKGEK